MAIPLFNHSGVLPQHDADGPAVGVVSPYRSSASGLVRRFGTSDARREILRSLLDYRQKLCALGLIHGFQWVDGSFLEDVESLQGRPPADVDIVTFARRPYTHLADSAWRALWRRNADLFDPQEAKRLYRCDAYFVDLHLVPETVVERTRYWFGLFSHQRDTGIWKVMVELPLHSDDDAARRLL